MQTGDDGPSPKLLMPGKISDGTQEIMPKDKLAITRIVPKRFSENMHDNDPVRRSSHWKESHWKESPHNALLIFFFAGPFSSLQLPYWPSWKVYSLQNDSSL
jgi:hypothetical protein